MDILIVCYLMWAIIGAMIFLINLESFEIDEDCFLLSQDFYETTNMNIFGCIMAALISYIIFPIPLILRLLINIIDFLIHVGRKK